MEVVTMDRCWLVVKLVIWPYRRIEVRYLRYSFIGLVLSCCISCSRLCWWTQLVQHLSALSWWEGYFFLYSLSILAFLYGFIITLGNLWTLILNYSFEIIAEGKVHFGSGIVDFYLGAFNRCHPNFIIFSWNLLLLQKLGNINYTLRILVLLIWRILLLILLKWSYYAVVIGVAHRLHLLDPYLTRPLLVYVLEHFIHLVEIIVVFVCGFGQVYLFYLIQWAEKITILWVCWRLLTSHNWCIFTLYLCLISLVSWLRVWKIILINIRIEKHTVFIYY